VYLNSDIYTQYIMSLLTHHNEENDLCVDTARISWIYTQYIMSLRTHHNEENDLLDTAHISWYIMGQRYKQRNKAQDPLSERCPPLSAGLRVRVRGSVLQYQPLFQLKATTYLSTNHNGPHRPKHKPISMSKCDRGSPLFAHEQF
jgi:hypothetical protein